MAKLVQTTVSLTERQSNFVRSEARRRDVPEGEVIRGFLDFCIDAVNGNAALCSTVFAAPIKPKSAA